jgi:type I restriction enzyme S subunit
MTQVKDAKTYDTPFPVYSSQTKSSGLCGYYSEFLFQDAITWTTDGANAGDVNYRPGKFYCTNVCGVLLNSEGYANQCVAALIGRISRQHVSYVGNPKLMNGVMSEILIPVPTVPEQHRIAACLSSLDDLLAAERQKLDALKAHKQGLMQQLFPRAGETVPRLRFPEFRKAGKWVTKVGGDLFTNRKEDGEEGLPIYSVTVNDGMIPRASFDREFYDIAEPAGNRKVCSGDIAYNMMRMWQGAQGVAPEDCMVSPAYVVLKPRSGVYSDFFAYLFKLPQALRLLTATSRGLTKDRLRLYFDDFARMRLCVPEYAEQHRIASCLTSLDDLIAAQGDKVEALKTHKKGLMQQLFPAPAEVEG